MSKHTPGPWKARQEFSNRWRIEVPCEGFAPVSVAIVTTTILEMGANDKDTGANARLIAAAPDLLSFAQKVIDHGYLKDDALWDEGKAAIARATASE